MVLRCRSLEKVWLTKLPRCLPALHHLYLKTFKCKCWTSNVWRGRGRVQHCNKTSSLQRSRETSGWNEAGGAYTSQVPQLPEACGLGNLTRLTPTWQDNLINWVLWYLQCNVNYILRPFNIFRCASISSTYPCISVRRLVCWWYFRLSILSASLSPHKASRRHCGGRHLGRHCAGHGGRHGGGHGGR